MAKKKQDWDISQFDDTFCKWFWNGTNGNNLIEKLNKYMYASKIKNKNFVRRESESPMIYAVIINNHPRLRGTEWKFVKVGFTHVNTQKKKSAASGGKPNRLEVVKNKIKTKLPETFKISKEQLKVKVLFKLPISATDTTSIYEIEDTIRKNFGLPLSKGLAEELGLPIKTEWVITREDYIRHFKKYVKKMKTANKLSTKIFNIEEYKSVKFKDYMKNVKKVGGEIDRIELRKCKDGSFEVCGEVDKTPSTSKETPISTPKERKQSPASMTKTPKGKKQKGKKEDLKAED